MLVPIPLTLRFISNNNDCYIFWFFFLNNLSFTFQEVDGARKVRSRLMDLIEAASLPGMPREERRRLLNVVVVGGGPTVGRDGVASNWIPKWSPLMPLGSWVRRWTAWLLCQWSSQLFPTSQKWRKDFSYPICWYPFVQFWPQTEKMWERFLNGGKLVYVYIILFYSQSRRWEDSEETECWFENQLPSDWGKHCTWRDFLISIPNSECLTIPGHTYIYYLYLWSFRWLRTTLWSRTRKQERKKTSIAVLLFGVLVCGEQQKQGRIPFSLNSLVSSWTFFITLSQNPLLTY